MQRDQQWDREVLRRSLERALAVLEEKRAYLNELDAATGDGDHGTAIVTAIQAAAAAAKTPDITLAALLEKIGWDVMTAASGSTSTLTGSFYIGMASAVTAENSEDLDTDATIAAFEAGLENVQRSTKAKVGDKTLMDALIPAIAAMQLRRGTQCSLADLFADAAGAAEAGVATTQDLVAMHGRARNLAERSRGHLDAGAVSTSFIYRAFADAVTTIS